MLGKSPVIGQVLRGARHALLVAIVVLPLVANGLVMTAPPSSAAQAPRATAEPQPKPVPVVADAQTLTPAQLSSQIKAAEALRANLTRSSAEVAAANGRLELFSAQANTLLANLSTARTAQVNAQTDLAAQRARLVALGVEVQAALDSLGRLASDAYIRGGGPLGDVAAIFDALTAPSPDQSTDSLATVQYLMDGRARIFDRLQTLRSEQVKTAARAEAASVKAAVAAKAAVEAKSKLDGVIAQQRIALDGFRATQVGQVGQAASMRGLLLRSDDPAARAADRRLAEALEGQDFMLLMDDSSPCGKDDPANYPNGLLPASALCPMYLAPGENLRRMSASAFNAMSRAYEKQTGSALCVTDGYRPYAEQVAVRIQSPNMTATPGKSQHGLGLAVDLCGGVENFAAPAHLWMQRNAPLYGWFHPAWAEPTGSMPEPWHWEFAN
jgi:zinc D-Ala-D-Ala carboxypeptidase